MDVIRIKLVLICKWCRLFGTERLGNYELNETACMLYTILMWSDAYLVVNDQSPLKANEALMTWWNWYFNLTNTSCVRPACFHGQHDTVTIDFENKKIAPIVFFSRFFLNTYTLRNGRVKWVNVILTWLTKGVDIG